MPAACLACIETNNLLCAINIPQYLILNLYLIHSAICRRCREHIGKAIASREDSEKPSESSASRLVNQQYPPSEVFVEPPTEVVELPTEPAELPLVRHFYVSLCLWTFRKPFFLFAHCI